MVFETPPLPKGMVYEVHHSVNGPVLQARVMETREETVRWVKVKIIDETPGDELWIEELVDEEEE